MKIEQDGEVKLKKRNPANRLTALILGLILVVIIVVVAIVVVIAELFELVVELFALIEGFQDVVVLHSIFFVQLLVFETKHSFLVLF